MSLDSQITTIVKAETGNNIPPEIVTITKTYTTAFVDIKTEDGIMKRIKSSRIPTSNDVKGLLIYPKGNKGKGFVLLF